MNAPPEGTIPRPPLLPTERIEAIKLSLRTWVLGICGFLPIIGLAPGVMALIGYFRAQSRYGAQWNPAARYLTAGAVLAAIGLVSSFIIVITVVAVVIFRVAN